MVSILVKKKMPTNRTTTHPTARYVTGSANAKKEDDTYLVSVVALSALSLEDLGAALHAAELMQALNQTLTRSFEQGAIPSFLVANQHTGVIRGSIWAVNQHFKHEQEKGCRYI